MVTMLRTPLLKESPFLDRLYGCSSNDLEINNVIDEIRYETSSSVSMLLLKDCETGFGVRLFSSGLSKKQHNDYLQQYHTDFWFTEYLDNGYQGLFEIKCPSKKHSVLDSDGMRFSVGAVCQTGRGISSIISYRNESTPFTAAELQSLQDLSDGLSVWSRHYWTAVSLQQQNNRLEHLVKRQKRAVAIIDGQYTIRYSNPEFDLIVSENVELQVQQGRLFFQERAARHDFGVMLSELPHALPNATKSVMISREGGLRPLHVQAHAMTKTGSTGDFIMLVIHDPEQAFSPDINALTNLYPLTDCEQELVLMLCKGYRNADIAKIRGVTLETTRSTLKSVFKKTDCHSQSELLLLLRAIS